MAWIELKQDFSRRGGGHDQVVLQHRNRKLILTIGKKLHEHFGGLVRMNLAFDEGPPAKFSIRPHVKGTWALSAGYKVISITMPAPFMAAVKAVQGQRLPAQVERVGTAVSLIVKLVPLAVPMIGQSSKPKPGRALAASK